MIGPMNTPPIGGGGAMALIMLVRACFFTLGKVRIMAAVNYLVVAKAVVARRLSMEQVCAEFNITAQPVSVKAMLTKYRRLYSAIGETGFLHTLAENGTAPVKTDQTVSDNVRKQAKELARLLSDAHVQLFGKAVRQGRGREKFDPIAALAALGLGDDTPTEEGDDSEE